VAEATPPKFEGPEVFIVIRPEVVNGEDRFPRAEIVINGWRLEVDKVSVTKSLVGPPVVSLEFSPRFVQVEIEGAPRAE
jgi:hypothetical protein